MPAPLVILMNLVDRVSLFVCDFGSIVTLCENTSVKETKEKRIDKKMCLSFIYVFMGKWALMF
ncbi:hypothetical protein D0T08_07365 [Emticicia sp. C21]|nr:hypothetical protein D0T08_07365 [Emticicia sp. C21]